MKVIDSRKQQGVEFKLYPDQQPHVKVKDIQKGDEVTLIWPIRSALELLQLQMCGNAVKHAGATIKELHIPYLMAARFDRLMEPGDSFDLEVLTDCIKQVGAEWVRFYDVHSDVAGDFLLNSTNKNNRALVETYDMPEAVLIIPDKGAVLKAARYAWWNKRLVDEITCTKTRDLSTGAITLHVHNADVCKDRNCIIIDDLCDGGGTFLAIADQIQPKHLTLMVTHGIFSKGFRKLEEKFQSIITTDSFYDWIPEVHSKILTVKPII